LFLIILHKQQLFYFFANALLFSLRVQLTVRWILQRNQADELVREARSKAIEREHRSKGSILDTRELRFEILSKNSVFDTRFAVASLTYTVSTFRENPSTVFIVDNIIPNI
jgi:hypothetical protein